MSIYSTLASTGLPCVYSHFKPVDGQRPTIPYIAYLGSGQTTFKADDTIYWKENEYQVEYYFTEKNEELEEEIESALLNAGYIYEKSEDVYIENEGVFVIYYYI